MSSGDKVKLRFVPEVIYNTTPADDSGWKPFRHTSEGLAGQPVVKSSEEVVSDRMHRNQMVVAQEIGGGYNFELHAGDPFDTMLQAALCGTWSTNVLKVGSTSRSFSVEKEYSDLSSGNRFIQFTGMRVNELELTIKHGEVITGSVAFAGGGVAAASSSAVGSGSEAAASTTVPITAAADLSGIEVDESAFAGCIQELTLKIANNLRPSNCVGRAAPSNQNYGMSMVTGKIVAYLSNNTIDWYKDGVLDRTAMSLEWDVGDGSNSYAILIPALKLVGPPPANPGLDNDVMLESEFEAFYDSSTGTTLQITRTVA